MAIVDSLPPFETPFKIDYFHEYDLNTEELFEVREIFTLPPPSQVPAPPPPVSRVDKLKNVFSKVTRKKSIKSNSMQSPMKTIVEDGSSAKYATFPRMKTEREKYIQDLHDEMFGIGAYAPPKVEKPDDDEPEPWVPPYMFRSTCTSRKVRTDGTVKVEKQIMIPEADQSKTKSLQKREDNPFWEEEFELPEPELQMKTPKTEEKQSTSGYIPIYISSSYTTKPKPSGEKPEKATDTSSTSEISNDSPSQPCSVPSAKVLTDKGVRDLLGEKIADRIVTEMTLRLGPPLPLPLILQTSEDAPDILKLREKTVVQTYALWGSIFLFQKLVLAIRLSLSWFKPTHRGMITFEFKVVHEKLYF